MTSTLSRQELQAICSRYDDAPHCNSSTKKLAAWVKVRDLDMSPRAASAPARKGRRSVTEKGLPRSEATARRSPRTRTHPKPASSAAQRGKPKPLARRKSLSLARSTKSSSNACGDDCLADSGNVYVAPDSIVSLMHVDYPKDRLYTRALPINKASVYGLDVYDRRIGEGAYGLVIRSTGLDGKLYATKISKQKEPISQDVLVEMATLLKLNHPNVVQIKDIVRLEGLQRTFETESPYGLVYDLADGDLRSYLKRTISAERKKTLMYDLLCGLSHIHSLEIIHRDLKPENTLLIQERAQIADLGSAKNYACHPRADWTDVITTLWYRAPELLQKEAKNRRRTIPKNWNLPEISSPFLYSKEIDIWSLGIIFYEIQTGDPIYRGAGDYDQLVGYVRSLKETSATMKRLRQLEVPLQDMFLSMLSFAPQQRPSASELLLDPYWDDVRDPSREYRSMSCSAAISMQSRSIDVSWSALPTFSAQNNAYALLKWIFDVAYEFEFPTRAISLAIKLVCEVLSQLAVDADSLQALGCACLDIAAKQSMYYPPEVDEYIATSKDAFTSKKFYSVEEMALEALQFDVSTSVPTDYSESKQSVGTEVQDLATHFALIMSFPSFSQQLILFPPQQVEKAAEELAEGKTLSSASKTIVQRLLHDWEPKKLNLDLKEILKKRKVDYEAVVAAARKALPA